MISAKVLRPREFGFQIRDAPVGSAEVGRCRFEQRGIIEEATNPDVAVGTQQPAHLPRLVVVVDSQSARPGRHLRLWLLADRTQTILSGVHRLVLLWRNPKLAPKNAGALRRSSARGLTPSLMLLVAANLATVGIVGVERARVLSLTA
jgi:hypothetical protein